MKDASQIVEMVLQTIRSIYKRPKMYGVNAGEIDAILWQYHRLWMDILERDTDDFFEAHRSVHGRRHLCNTSFSHHYRTHTKNGAEACEDDAIEFVIRSWKKMDTKLGIALPLE
jgi:hypothetical protein